MLFRKIFENLHAVTNGYFSAVKIIFWQILFEFFAPNSECLAKYDAFFSHVFDYACLRLIAISKRFENTQKLYTSKPLLKMAGGRMDTPGPHSTPWIRPWP